MASKVFQANERVRIELNDGRQIEADFVQTNRSSISVKNVVESPSGKRYRHTVTFYLHSIKDCYATNDRSKCIENSILSKDTSSTSSQVDSSNNGSGGDCSSSSSTATSSVECMKKSFGHSEIERIEFAMKNAVYISQFDDKYHGAINDLKQQKVIAVNSENHFGRLEPMRPLIAVASGHRVYLFDMLRLGAMKKEFKEVFSADSPRKIIHRSTNFNDYLTHTEKCTLANAFDTLMVHFTLKQTRECISLLDCLKVYFDLPEASFDFAGKNFNFAARPLHDDAKLRSALNVQLLMELYWHFNDILMRPLRVATQQFSDIYASIDNQVDSMIEMNNRTYPGVENIDLNAVNELEELFADFLAK